MVSSFGLAFATTPRLADLDHVLNGGVASTIGDMAGESEWKTRKKRIDPKLDAAGWRLRGKDAHRTEEEETANGPADYALWLDKSIVGVVEAKKLTVGPQNVLTQAERYARGLDPPRGRDNSTAALPVPLRDERRGRLVPRRPASPEPLAPSLRLPHAGRRAGAARPRLRRRVREAAGDAQRWQRLRPYQRDANAASRGPSRSGSATCSSRWRPGRERRSRS